MVNLDYYTTLRRKTLIINLVGVFCYLTNMKIIHKVYRRLLTDIRSALMGKAKKIDDLNRGSFRFKLVAKINERLLVSLSKTLGGSIYF